MTCPLILKLDADSVIFKDFFIKHPLKSNESIFYSGNWRIAKDENSTHLNGLLFCPSNALIKSGGYNEKLKDYGYDDTSLYEKLLKDGYTRKDINQDFAQHIPHSAKIRSGEGDPVIYFQIFSLKK